MEKISLRSTSIRKAAPVFYAHAPVQITPVFYVITPGFCGINMFSICWRRVCVLSRFSIFILGKAARVTVRQPVAEAVQSTLLRQDPVYFGTEKVAYVRIW
jgi:hypothetical protein